MLPNLIIIGSMKCGTVSLHKYLGLHPEVCMSPIDEVDFFVEERNWPKGLDWYQAHFSRQTPVVGERSTAYAKFPTFCDVPKRMHRLLPNTKLIYCVRDPVERCISQYVHEVSRGRENRPAEAAIGDNHFENPYIYYSRYFFQLQQYLEYYDRGSILIVHLEDMARKRASTLARIFDFLGIDTGFTHEEFNQTHHKSSELRRETWFKTRFGHMRGMYRLEKLVPGLFLRPVHKPNLSERFRSRLAEAFDSDAEKFSAYERELSWPITA